MSHQMAALVHCIKKAEEWAQENKVEESTLIDGKLAPDMFSLPKQIYICTDGSKFVLSRVLGKEVPSWEDNETTLAGLRGRLEKAIDLLKTVTEKDFEGKEDAPVGFKTGPSHSLQVSMTGLSYLQHFALPMFFFHVVTAYDILRNAGVPLGKQDYLIGGLAPPSGMSIKRAE